MSYRIILGAAVERSLGSRLDVKSAPAAAPSSEGRLHTILTRGWDWYMRLPRPIAAIVAVAGFLFLINVFTGLNDIWFHWPVAALLLIVVLWTVIRRKPP